MVTGVEFGRPHDPVADEFNQGLEPAQAEHIQLIPYSDGHAVWRRFPPKHLMAWTPDLDHQSADRVSRVSEEHFGMLRERGVVVPKTFESTVLQDNLGRWVIDTVTEYIPATPFSYYRSWARQGEQATFQPQARRLAEILLSYYLDVLSPSNTEKLYLHEIRYLQQYGITTSGDIVLHDTDQAMTEVTNRRMSLALGHVKEWATYIQPSSQVARLCAKIRSSITELRTRDVW